MAKKLDWTEVGGFALGGAVGYGLDYVFNTYVPQLSAAGKWVTPAITAAIGLGIMYIGDDGMIGDIGAGTLAYGVGRVLYTVTVSGSAA